MNNDINEAAKEASHISEITKKISIYDGIVNVISAWDLVTPTTITKCLKSCGISMDGFTPDDSDESNDVNLNAEFNDMPWEQFEEMKREFLSEGPGRAPNGRNDSTNNDDHDHDDEQDADPLVPEIMLSESVTGWPRHRENREFGC